MLLLTLSEELFEDPAKVEFARNMMLQNPHPQDPRPSAGSSAPARAMTPATGSPHSRCRCT